MKLHDAEPSEIAGPLRGLREHPGFALICEKFDAEIRDLKQEIENENLSAEETQKNKRALARMILVRPDRLCDALLNTAGNNFRKSQKLNP